MSEVTNYHYAISINRFGQNSFSKDCLHRMDSIPTQLHGVVIISHWKKLPELQNP